MKLVVGLGNPGRQYQNNRHNVGFWVLDRLALWAGSPAWSNQFDGMVASVSLPGGKCLLLKPMTYMNRSGQAVRKAVDFYKVSLGELLVVCDDFALNIGKLRFRASGSAGGHNGLKDIFAHLGTQDIPRLKVGIGQPGVDVIDHVLGDFSASEKKLVDDCVTEAGRAVECWSREGLAFAMNEYNGKDLAKE